MLINPYFQNFFSKKLLFALLFFVSIFSFTPTAVLADAAGDKASQYCSGKAEAAACEYGFKAGYEEKKGGVCWAKYDNERKNDKYKACADGKKEGTKQKNAPTEDKFAGKEKCGNVGTFFDFGCGAVDPKGGGSNNPIFRILLTVIAWLTAGVMVAVIGGIVYGGFLYLTAQDNASQTQKGIIVIVDSVIGLILFGLMWTILNFIIPGGIYN